MAPHRKTHSNAWETALTPEQCDQAFELCRDLGYVKAAHLIAKEFGIRAPSVAGICRFYERMARIRQQRDIEKALVDVSNLDLLAAKLPQLGAAKKAALDKALLDALITRDPERIKLFAELVLKQQAADTDAARLQLQLDKYRDAVAATRAALEGEATKGGITPETAAIMRKLLLDV